MTILHQSTKTINKKIQSVLKHLKATALPIILATATTLSQQTLASDYTPNMINIKAIDVPSELAMGSSSPLSEVAEHHFKRLTPNIATHQNNYQKEILVELIKLFSATESSNNPTAKNKDSSATSYFQFLTENGSNIDGNFSSLMSALNRLERSTNRLPQDLIDLKNNPTSEQLIKTPYTSQAMIVLGDLLGKTFSKEGIKAPGLGDRLFKILLDQDSDIESISNAAQDIYNLGHHTDPNKASNKNLKNNIGSFEKAIAKIKQAFKNQTQTQKKYTTTRVF